MEYYRFHLYFEGSVWVAQVVKFQNGERHGMETVIGPEFPPDFGASQFKEILCDSFGVEQKFS